jgi:HlyD family secretion protein
LQTELDNEEREFRRYQQLGRDGAISDSTLDSRRLAWETAREKLQEARANLQKTLATLTEEIRETRAESKKDIDSLQEQIQEARAELDRIAEIRDVDLEKARREVERAIANLEHVREDWQMSQVRAPFRGQVLKIHSFPGEKADSEQGIMDLGRTDRMAVIAEIYESDIAKVNQGQRAEIVSENASFPNKIYGSVTQVGLEIGKRDVLETDPAADVDVRVVEVKILLDPESSRVVAGLTNAKVIVEILL